MQSSQLPSSFSCEASNECPDYICLMSLSGDILYLTPEIFGIQGTVNATQLMHPDDYNFLFSHMDNVINSAGGVQLSLRFRTGFETQFLYSGVVRLAHASELEAYPAAPTYTLAFTKQHSGPSILHAPSDLMHLPLSPILGRNSRQLTEPPMTDIHFTKPAFDTNNTYVEDWLSLAEDNSTRKSSTASFVSTLDSSSVFTPTTVSSIWYQGSTGELARDDDPLSPRLAFVPEEIGIKSPSEMISAAKLPHGSDFDFCWPHHDAISSHHASLASAYDGSVTSGSMDFPPASRASTPHGHGKIDAVVGGVKKSHLQKKTGNNKGGVIQKSTHKRDSASSSKGSKSDGRRTSHSSARRSKGSRPCITGHECVECGVSESPEWRKGPAGPKSLCNACGLRYSKYRVKQNRMKCGNGVVG